MGDEDKRITLFPDFQTHSMTRMETFKIPREILSFQSDAEKNSYGFSNCKLNR